MKMKPIPLAAFTKDLIPPVTGLGGTLAPVANSYDTSGNFAARPRNGSLSKKRRIDEIDRVFDLSEPYPPLTPPGKPTLDMGEIKTLLVAATAAGEDIGPMLDSPDLDPKIKAFGNLGMALLGVVSAIIENGLVPLSGGPPRDAEGAGAFKRAGPPPPPKVATGFRELKESLEKADCESILFDADLGNVTMGNRHGLNAAFSNGIRKAVLETAAAKNLDPAESVRAMNDALECVSEMDFIGLKSERSKNKDPVTNAQKEHFTMPVKLKFEDRNSRLYFEKSIKSHCGLRATMSLPRPIREEQGLFANALRARYPGDAISARPDVASMHFIAFKKGPTEKKWTRCSETIPIPNGIVLPDYKVRTSIILPPAVVVNRDAEGVDPQPAIQSQEATPDAQMQL
jgi:hypothetical protein